MVRNKSDSKYVSETATNLSYVIDKLVQEDDYSYEDIGALFIKSLEVYHNDIPAYISEDILPHELYKIQKDAMKKIKYYFLRAHSEKDKPFDKDDLIINRELNDNSLSSLVNYFIQKQGKKKRTETETLEHIGLAVHEGSQEYLKKNPIAKESNFYQYKEYKHILEQLQKLKEV